MNKEEYEKMYRLEDIHWWYVGMRRVSAALLDGWGRRGGLILDAGCGTGGILGFLEGYGLPFGVDIAPEAMDFCRLRGRRRVCRASVARLPFRDASFDLVTSFDVLYHQRVEDDVAVLREFYRVLKGGGMVLLRVPAFDFLRRSHDIAVHTRHRYRAGELKQKLRQAGLAVSRVAYANSTLFPLVLAGWLLEGGVRWGGGFGLADTSPPLNRLLAGLLTLEARWVRRFALPFGLSLFALACKPLVP